MSGERYLLDTNAIVALLHGNNALSKRLAEPRGSESQLQTRMSEYDNGPLGDEPEPQVAEGLTRSKLFAEFNCERTEYEVRIGLEKFDYESFKKAFYESSRQPLEKASNGGDALGATEKSDYHVHFGWQMSKGRKMFRMKLAYVEGELKPSKGDDGPYAEGFMNWLSPFFRNGSAEAHVFTLFEYAKAGHQCLLPIPMTLATEAKELPQVEVSGMVIELPKLQGMQQAHALLSEKNLAIGLSGSRSIVFADFDLRNELSALSSIAKILAKEVRE